MFQQNTKGVLIKWLRKDPFHNNNKLKPCSIGYLHKCRYKRVVCSKGV